VAVVKELRGTTGAGVMDCRKALLEVGGDMDKAVQLLRQQGLAKAERKSKRTAGQGVIESYIHPGGRIGAMIEVNCETDFVARTEEFRGLAHHLAMQVAALSPKFISREDIPQGIDIDPEEACLLQQPFIKEPDKTVQEVVAETIGKVGENIRVSSFVRFGLGDQIREGDAHSEI
jgi:elongation factor Ts